MPGKAADGGLEALLLIVDFALGLHGGDHVAPRRLPGAFRVTFYDRVENGAMLR